MLDLASRCSLADATRISIEIFYLNEVNMVICAVDVDADTCRA